MQARLIRQAQSSSNIGTKNNNTRVDDDREAEEDDEEGDKPDINEEEKQATVEGFMAAISGQAEATFVGRDIMRDIVDLIIAVPEATIINYL